jgi:hypothetical protein
MTQSDEIWLDSDSDQECAQFQASMADRISAGEDLQDHPHMQTCERCSALVSELESIADAVRQLMPLDLEPGDDLWSKIESKLALEGDADAEGDSTSHENNNDNAKVAPGGLVFEGGAA